MRTKLGRFALIVVAVAAVAALSGCVTYSTSMTFTFSVETGDNIAVELDTSSGYELRPEGSDFFVSKDGSDIVGGMFLTEVTYEQLVSNAHDDPRAQFVTDVKDNYEYTYSPEDGGETYYLLWVPGSNTGIGLFSQNNATVDQVEKAVDLLTFTAES